MPRFLLGEPLAQGFHQLFPAAQRLDELFFLLGQKALGQFLEPLLGYLGGRVRQGLDALKALAENPIEAVEMALVFNQRSARDKVKILDRERRDAPLHRLHQAQIFAQ